MQTTYAEDINVGGEAVMMHSPLNSLKSLFLIGITCAAFGACPSGYATDHGAAPQKQIAILLFDGVDVIDFAAPEDIFSNAGMKVFTVSASGGTITTADGLKVTPTYSYAAAPKADALVIPGGGTSRIEKDTTTLAWIKQRYADGETIMSVCNGAFTLANTGLLHGMKATTTSGNIDALRKAHADINVVRTARVVDNGRIITTGGYSAGIDGALHLIARMAGDGKAQWTAELIEYDAQPEGSFLPATHGFHVMHQTLGNENLTGFGHIDTLVSTAGDTNRWRYVWLVHSKLGNADLADRIDLALADERKEMQGMDMNGPYASSPGHHWTFVDTDGETWKEKLEVSDAGEAGQYLVALSVEKAGK